MPVARHIFGRDKPSLTDLAHCGAGPTERRRAIALQQLFQPRPLRIRLAANATRGARNSKTTSVGRHVAWRILLVTLPIIAATLAISGQGFAACRASPALLRFGAEIDTSMSVRAGWACPLLLKTASQGVDDLDVMIPPRRGTLTMRGRTGVVYRADPDFRGTDTFALAARSAPSAGPGIATIRVQVSVR